MSESIIDLDTINPEPKYIKLKDKKIDISIIPFECILDIVDRIDKYNIDGGELPPTKIMLEAFGDVISKLLKERDKTITDKWIAENLNGIMFLRLINEVILPLVNELNVSANSMAGSGKTKKK